MKSHPDPPRLDPVQRLLLPIADGFMVLMLSRPPSGSLRTTRVTLASIGLSAASSLAFGLAGVLVAVSGRGPLPIGVGVALELFALGCLSLALFGLLQRRHVNAGP